MVIVAATSIGWSRREIEERGGIDGITPAGIVEVFDKLCDYFGFREGR